MPIHRPLWLLSLALLFVAHQVSQKALGWSIPWADGYLDALLCMPLLLSGYLMERRWLFGAGHAHVLGGWEVLGFWGVLSAVFEGLFPYLSPRFTADAWDVLAYAVGAAFFHLVFNRPLAVSAQRRQE